MALIYYQANGTKPVDHFHIYCSLNVTLKSSPLDCCWLLGAWNLQLIDLDYKKNKKKKFTFKPS